VAYLLGWWIALFVVWLLLVDSLARPEVAAGPAAALLAAVAALAVRAQTGVRFRLRRGWFRQLGGVPWSVLRDSGILAVALWRRLVRGEHPRSLLRLVPIQAAGDEPEAAAWRAFATIVTSIAPNTYVIGIDRERGVALVHQLVADDPERLRRALARPNGSRGGGTGKVRGP
jgi:multisubunit Na+/H+ antiporter MnhE subunit